MNCSGSTTRDTAIYKFGKDSWSSKFHKKDNSQAVINIVGFDFSIFVFRFI